MNVVLASGAVHDLELRYTPSGLAVATARLSGTREITTSHGEVKEVFSTVGFTLFGKPAEWAAQDTEGREGQVAALIHGRLSYRAYETQAGEKRSSLDVIADSFRRIENTDVHQGEYGPLLAGCRNEASVIGNLTKDADMRYAPSGTAVLRLSLAVNEYDRQAKEEKAHFVDVTAFGELAERYAELRKGQAAFARGSLKLNSWTPEGSDTKRYRLELTADDLEAFARANRADDADGPRQRARTSNASGSARPAGAKAKASTLDIDDEFPPEEDLPFDRAPSGVAA